MEHGELKVTGIDVQADDNKCTLTENEGVATVKGEGELEGMATNFFIILELGKPEVLGGQVWMKEEARCVWAGIILW